MLLDPYALIRTSRIAASARTHRARRIKSKTISFDACLFAAVRYNVLDWDEHQSSDEIQAYVADENECDRGSGKVEASVRSGVAVGFDAYGCGNVSDGDDADVSTCGSWRLLHLTDASVPFRRYDE